MKKDEIFGINERYGVVVPPAICVLPQIHPCYRCVWLCHTDVPFCMLPAGSSLCRHIDIPNKACQIKKNMI